MFYQVCLKMASDSLDHVTFGGTSSAHRFDRAEHYSGGFYKAK